MFSINMETLVFSAADWVPLNCPSAAEYLHLLYAVATPLLLLGVTPDHT